jgi:flagellar biosynthesis protein FliQ
MHIDALHPLAVTDTAVMHLALQVMLVCLKLSAPILLTALVIGFAISLFQSVTQIQEFTLAFVPKVIGIGIALLLSGNWMLHTLIAFTQKLFEQIPSLLN